MDSENEATDHEGRAVLNEGRAVLNEGSNWLTVSPAKVGRSPVRSAQSQTEETLISASKFSVLSKMKRKARY
ncbi:hypothetical protein F2Q70_00003743 [Brassica cretica]|uniref:Uncharacterized protein n=1 Tax=Brassica cretica TaxID=69181 RepID=A0A8S9IK98_BRACR|nr:hypothetical protein F2Q70_00003743 [Brassica cretica]